MINAKAFLQTLTTHPGVYQMLGEDGNVLYVGKARNLKKRLSSYFSGKQQDNKTLALLKRVKDINVTITHSENDALLLECNLIKKHQPHYNILFRDDKSYPYILITTEKPYPSIDIYRGPKKGHGRYFGPYPNSMAVRETIHMIQKLFGLRLANDKYHPTRKRPCLQYQIGLCSGSCASKITVEEYQRDVEHAILFLQGKNPQILHDLDQQMEDASKQLNYELAGKLRDQMMQLREIQAKQYVSSEHGNADIIGFAMKDLACIHLLVIRGGRILGSRVFFPSFPQGSHASDIVSSFISQHYLAPNKDLDAIPKEIILDIPLPERTWLAHSLSAEGKHKVTFAYHVRGERKKWLEMANNSAKQALMTQVLNQTHLHDRFFALQNVLQLAALPQRIECFDVSHTMGEATVASCVVFTMNGPLKSDYRRFNIQGITPGDDVAAMHQVLQRRFKRLQSDHTKHPDIILIDGGRTQLRAANTILNEFNIKNIMLIGVAKGAGRKPGLETLHFVDREPYHLPSDSPALHLIQHIRDEAHRFAITGHRMRRDKKRQTSVLESIPGIGAKRRQELLRYFGGIQAINRASLDELANVPGISQSLAERIFAALHVE